MLRTLMVLFCSISVCAQDFGTLQEAIDRAEENSLIKVPPGIYKERIVLEGKSVRLIGWNFERNAPGHPFTHIIVPPADGNPDKSVVTVSGNVGNSRQEVVVEGFSVMNGRASRGAGIMIRGNVFAEIHRCYVAGNEASSAQVAPDDEIPLQGAGGGVFIGSQASCAVISSMISANRSGGDGAAIFVASPAGPVNRTVSIVNATITDNHSPEGAALFLGKQGAEAGDSFCLYNNIVWENDSIQDVVSTSPVTFHYSLLGKTENVECEGATCVQGPPDFLNADQNLFRLKSTSALRNRGLSAPPCLVRPFNRPADRFADIDGDFPPGTRCAIGADSPAGPLDPQEAFIRGDVRWGCPWESNYSHGIEDATCVLSYLFEQEPECERSITQCKDAADANDDGVMDLADAVYILSYFSEIESTLPDPFPQAGEDPTGDGLDCLKWGCLYRPPQGSTFAPVIGR